MTIASIIIPIAPHHASLASRAIAAASAQTVACEVIPVIDRDRRGPGWARNRGIEQATGEYVVFLDADDAIAPTFVEKCVALAKRNRAYVYTDWQTEDGKFVAAPDCAWVNGSYHVVTTLLPRRWATGIGGFDEALPGGEDTEFYVHLCTSGKPGIRLPEPLFMYGRDGKRSKLWKDSAAFAEVMQTITERYGGKPLMCCGQSDEQQSPVAAGGNQIVWARPVWGGKRREVGAVTGNQYGRIDSADTIQVDYRDIAGNPDWVIVEHSLDGIDELAAYMAAAFGTDTPMYGAPQPPVLPIGSKGTPAPDFSRLLNLYNGGGG